MVLPEDDFLGLFDRLDFDEFAPLPIEEFGDLLNEPLLTQGINFFVNFYILLYYNLYASNF